jgi:aspartyl-tRNA(Asn)/glutamyl-tRNA(Gln) amidotransferase subunit A
MRYGQQDGDLSLKFDDYFTSFRSQYFGDEAKRRILLGTFTRMVGYADRYYNKALRVRQSVISEYKKVYADHDAIVTPTMPFVSPRFDDIAKMSALDVYKADFLTVPANLAGTPHLNCPCGYNADGMPIGMQFVSDHWNEDVLLTMAEEWDKQFEVRKAEVSL